MDGSTVSGNASTSLWPSLAPFEVSVYLRDFTESLDARRFQEMSARGYSRTVHNAQQGVKCETRGCAWIKR